MRRDKKLIKAVLEWALEKEDFVSYTTDMPKIDGYSQKNCDYHVYLCVKAGFLDGQMNEMGGGKVRSVRALTWTGHELLEELTTGNVDYTI